MKLGLHDTMFVNEFYLNYLINGNPEELTQEEIGALLALNKEFHIDICGSDYSVCFTTCKISGLYANCAEIHLYKRIAS